MIRMMLKKGWFFPLKSEKPLVFEKGGASKREGEAQIICGEDFSPLIPLRLIAISAAHKKATCIRCRTAHYYIKEE